MNSSPGNVRSIATASQGCARRAPKNIAIAREPAPGLKSTPGHDATLNRRMRSGQLPFLNERCKFLPTRSRVLKQSLRLFIRGGFSQILAVRGADTVPFNLLFLGFQGSPPFRCSASFTIDSE